jgi:hypothetical protein
LNIRVLSSKGIASAARVSRAVIMMRVLKEPLVHFLLAGAALFGAYAWIIRAQENPLATLGYVHVPPAPVEALIALSIAFVAVEIVRQWQGCEGLTARAPWLVAFTFGLLHGLGFAGALSEIGLPEGQIPLALLFFNIGVEIGQLLFIAAMLGVFAMVRRARPSWPRWGGLVAPYAIGSIAMFWVIERVAAF